ncbi:MAG: DUF5694 domain-containing protein [Parvularculaceae bacterium]
MRAILAAALAAFAFSTANAANPEPVKVMVVGAWHFEGSSADLASADSANVLEPVRQKELAAVADALAAFKPTMVVTERVTAAPDYIDPKFADFTDETLKTDADERVQIAYRLAKRAGVARVLGLDERSGEDEPDYFPFDKVTAHAEATGQKEKLDAMIAGVQQMVAMESERHKKMTMAAALVDTNTGKFSSPDFYYELMRFDRGEDEPGAELNAYWFMRNAKIFSKLMGVAKPGDRVVIVYGAGHKFWLDHLARQTPGFESVEPAPYLKKAK